MESTQLILLCIGGFFVLAIVIYALGKKVIKKKSALAENDHHDPAEEELPCVYEENIENEDIREEKIITTEKKSGSTSDDFIMISVHAKPNKIFADYDFLQTLGSVGLIYGEHKIFHYDVKTDIGVQRLFSVAQLNKPGTFDIDHVETLHCKGLLLFIDLRACRKLTLALDCMLEVAYQLAEDLDGTMFEGYNTPWQEDTPRALAQHLEIYQKNGASVLDEITC